MSSSSKESQFRLSSSFCIVPEKFQLIGANKSSVFCKSIKHGDETLERLGALLSSAIELQSKGKNNFVVLEEVSVRRRAYKG